MDTKELKEFIKQFEIDGTGDLLLGIFQPGMTVYNQQLRALNIFYAALETGKIKKGDQLAVIGAGVAGLSFSLAALKKGFKVDLFEKCSLNYVDDGLKEIFNNF
ncbi:NAD(P)-binding protein [Winogradskyella flava]|uniref:NAD(P)-binding protein n=1 Tax=Winogradskyella flava TaxID=1884876 RepID=A0A842ISD9_9FLAO|nr:NAD(P)-binding protein [Winogradskyella flava]MBC2845069.1 NAD(P)-binding protein [Winogradskyella flava]